MPTPTSGWRSSEFWISLAVVVTSAVLASGFADDSLAVRIAGIAATVLTALGYTVNRTKLKSSL
jgi:hypothetical protein